MNLCLNKLISILQQLCCYYNLPITASSIYFHRKNVQKSRLKNKNNTEKMKVKNLTQSWKDNKTLYHTHKVVKTRLSKSLTQSCWNHSQVYLLTNATFGFCLTNWLTLPQLLQVRPGPQRRTFRNWCSRFDIDRKPFLPYNLWHQNTEEKKLLTYI